MKDNCDIPLSNVKNHTSTYGKYAIGLTKEWGIENKIQPVSYVHSNSPVLELLENIYGELKKLKKSNSDRQEYLKISTGTMTSAVYNILRYIKPYEGLVINENKKEKNLKFYDEREWRYTPLIKELKDILKEVDKKNKHLPLKDIYLAEIFKDMTQARAINYKVHSYLKLRFRPEDIRFIIVASEDEIPEFIDHIEDIKWKDSVSSKEVKILTSRIISLNQVVKDI